MPISLQRYKYLRLKEPWDLTQRNQGKKLHNVLVVHCFVAGFALKKCSAAFSVEKCVIYSIFIIIIIVFCIDVFSLVNAEYA